MTGALSCNSFGVSAAPLLSFGFERSGTTLLSQMLNSHPHLAVPFTPTGLWYRKARALAEYNNLHSIDDAERLASDLLGEDRIKAWNIRMTIDDIRPAFSPGDYASIVRRFHQVYADAMGKSHWGLHDIATLFDMDMAFHWFPEARFVQIVRDVRDVALSFVDYPYGSDNMVETAAQWAFHVHANLKMGAILGPDHYMTIKYEDLVLNPVETLTKIAKFSGLRYSDDMLKYGESVKANVPQDKMSLWPALGAALDAARLGQWQRQPAHRVKAVEEAASPVMAALGYETDLRPVSRWKFELYAVRCALDRGKRIRRARQRAARLFGGRPQ